MKLNRALSRKLSTLLMAEDKMCFQNALRAASHLPGAIYIEGYCVTGPVGLINEHGWVEYKGEIIDTTPIYHEGKAKSHYFPAERYDTHARCVATMKHKQLPFMPLDHLRLPQFQAAYVAASRHLYGSEQTDEIMGRFSWYQEYKTRRQHAKR